jgi:RimJ/RimL family protein N-acetyltransferase
MENRRINRGYELRKAYRDDVTDYCACYAPLDAEAARMMGNPAYQDPEMVRGFFGRILDDEDYHLFVLVNPERKIIGEAALNEEGDGAASFRICIFDPAERGRGLGSWMVENMMDYAFHILDLDEIELEVRNENERAIHVYERFGFVKKGKDSGMILMRCRRRQYEEEETVMPNGEYCFSL